MPAVNQPLQPSRAEPSRAEPSRAEPSRAEPSLRLAPSSGHGPGTASPPLRAVPGLSPPRAPLLRGCGGGAGPARGPGSRARAVPVAGQRRHAVRGAGHQPAGRAAAAGAGHDPVRRRRRHPGQTGGEGERDGAERAAHGAVGLGGALRPAARLLHRRGGHGGAEPAAQRPILRRADGAAGPRARADCHPLFPTGALADRQEQDSHDIPVILSAARWNKAIMKATHR